MLISHALWQRRFHSDPAAVGRTLIVDGIARTIVGVVPHELGEMVAADVWLPTAIDPASTERGNRNYGVVARLKPDVTAAQARAEMNVIAARLEKEYPAANSGVGVTLFPMSEMFTGRIRPVLLILLGAVGLLLLIACANLANLLLARAATREREIAIRGALGARRARLIRQLLTETLVLSLAGGALGLLLAVWGVRLLRSIVPDMFPMLQHMQRGPARAGFHLRHLDSDRPAVRLGSGVEIFAHRPEHHAQGSRRAFGKRRRIASHPQLPAGAEVALAVLLSVSAGLLLRSFVRVTEVRPRRAHGKYSHHECEPARREIQYAARSARTSTRT